MRLNQTALLKAADALAGNALCRLLGCLPSLAVRDPAVLTIRPEAIRRILVIRPGGMGDMLLLLPVLRRLRERLPNAVVDLACERRNLSVLALVDMADRAMVYDGHPFAFLWRLRRAAYDLVLDTEQFHHFSAVFALLSGAPLRIGFKINPVRNPLYTHLVNYAPDGAESAQFARLLEPAGFANDSPELCGLLAGREFPLPQDAPGRLASFLAGGPAIVMHPAASVRYKQWPAGRFAELAVALGRECRLRSVLVGNRADRKTCERIAQAAAAQGAEVLSMAGGCALPGTAALIQRARLFVGADSGLAHLAVALDVPSVVLFGPSDAAKWGSGSPRHAAVHRALPCAPCFIFGYHKPCRTIACMGQISVADVLAQCRRLL